MSGMEGLWVGACIASAACVAVWTLRALWRDVRAAIWEEGLQASRPGRARSRASTLWEVAA